MKCGAGVADAVFVGPQLHEMRCRFSGFSVCKCSVASHAMQVQRIQCLRVLGCMKFGAGVALSVFVSAQLHEMRCRRSGFSVCECSVA